VVSEQEAKGQHSRVPFSFAFEQLEMLNFAVLGNPLHFAKSVAVLVFCVDCSSNRDEKLLQPSPGLFQ